MHWHHNHSISSISAISAEHERHTHSALVPSPQSFSDVITASLAQITAPLAPNTAPWAPITAPLAPITADNVAKQIPKKNGFRSYFSIRLWECERETETNYCHLCTGILPFMFWNITIFYVLEYYHLCYGILPFMYWNITIMFCNITVYVLEYLQFFLSNTCFCIHFSVII